MYETAGLRVGQGPALSLTLYELRSPLSLSLIQTYWTTTKKSWQKSWQCKDMWSMEISSTVSSCNVHADSGQVIDVAQ